MPALKITSTTSTHKSTTTLANPKSGNVSVSKSTSTTNTPSQKSILPREDKNKDRPLADLRMSTPMPNPAQSRFELNEKKKSISAVVSVSQNENNRTAESSSDEDTPLSALGAIAKQSARLPPKNQSKLSSDTFAVLGASNSEPKSTQLKKSTSSAVLVPPSQNKMDTDSSDEEDTPLSALGKTIQNQAQSHPRVSESPAKKYDNINVTINRGQNNEHQNGNNTHAHSFNGIRLAEKPGFGLPAKDDDVTELSEGMAGYLNSMLRQTMLALVKFSKHRQSCAETKREYAKKTQPEDDDEDSILPRLDGEARRNALRGKLYQVNKDLKILQAAEKGGLKRGSKNKAARLLKRERDNPGSLKEEKKKVISAFLNRTKVFYDKPEDSASSTISNPNGQASPLQIEKADLVTFLKTNNDPSRRLWLSLLNDPEN
eukprot:CAMPEP_0204828594 /NCGR_PEP_ID=MMETSP1346-20131115/6431_1 /ASSEMBLY_ACC=CAM_ASM_000771 /TAXON_ID=215587 /ORGANISM="Aplanochytrium stocchinoi, Strain GSBS06" /LENGTH=429 /DNA_ID=CAMNT_0051957793 /DNA_START=69 /DNA_END=1358 /DNA_ORIENTATION=+